MKVFVRALLAAAVPVSATAAGLCLNPFGCEPKTYEECIADASSKPTEAGVKLASKACHDRFLLPAEQAAARKAAADADAFATKWADLGSQATTIAEAIKLLGPPYLTSPAGACAPLDGVRKTSRCYTYYWQDARPGHFCTRSNYTACMFQLEAVADSNGLIWAWWAEPI